MCVGGGRGASVNSYELSTDCTAQLEDDVHGTVFMDRYSCLCYRKIPVSVSLVTWQWLRVWEELKLSDDLVLVNVWEIPC